MLVHHDDISSCDGYHNLMDIIVVLCVLTLFMA